MEAARTAGFGYELPIPKPKELIGRCTLWDKNPTCHKERCMFNPLIREKAEAKNKQLKE